MGKVFDPELYRASEKDFARHPLPSYFVDKWETWHTDAIYDNGYYSTIMFATNGPVIMVELHIIDPTGNPVVESMQFFEPNEYKASTEALNIKMGENFYRGKYPKYQLSVHDGNNGAELFYESTIEPIITEIPDGVGLGHVSTPFMPVSVSWFLRPRNKITGKLIVEGKEIPVTGMGFADHQWGNSDYMKTAVRYFSWANFPIGKHTLNLFEGQLNETCGYRPYKWMWDWKGEKIYEYDRDCDFYVKVSDIEPGDTVPHKILFIFEHSRIRGTITCDLKTVIQKQPIELEDRIFTINRSSYNCHAKLKIDNERFDTKFERIIEIGYPVNKAEDIPEVETETIEIVAEEKTSKFSQNSKLGELLKDPEATAVLERYVPGISTSSQSKMGANMAIKKIFSFPQAGVSKEKLAAIDEELRAIK
jgi:hypothetical protein